MGDIIDVGGSGPVEIATVTCQRPLAPLCRIDRMPFRKTFSSSTAPRAAKRINSLAFHRAGSFIGAILRIICYGMRT